MDLAHAKYQARDYTIGLVIDATRVVSQCLPDDTSDTVCRFLHCIDPDDQAVLVSMYGDSS